MRKRKAPRPSRQQVNLYQCSSCDHKWMDVWECACNDTCPACGTREIEPYGSIDQAELDEVSGHLGQIA